jgi:hypothetical protein
MKPRRPVHKLYNEFGLLKKEKKKRKKKSIKFY